MIRLLGFLVFFVVATLVVLGAHYYLWMRLVRDPAWPSPWARVGSVSMACLALGLPAGMFAARASEQQLAKALVWALFVWMGLMFILVVLLGLVDLLRVGGVLAARLVTDGGAPIDPSRRTAMARLLAGGVAFVGLGAGAVGVMGGVGVPDVRKLVVRLARLPAAAGGTRLVQLSDLHIGPTIGRAWLAEVVARVNALDADVVAITGDLVDGSVASLRDSVAPLADLRARYGVYFVTGNHEYYSGVDEWLVELERLGVRTLRNERVTIGSGEQSFELAGVDDASAARFGGGHGPDLARALAGYDTTRELVLLAHQPKAIYGAAESGVGLQLSGHTHGGQIWPWGLAVLLQQPYVAGLHQHGPTQVYVSRGTGYWGPPMRLGAPAEITLLELASGKDDCVASSDGGPTGS